MRGMIVDSLTLESIRNYILKKKSFIFLWNNILLNLLCLGFWVWLVIHFPRSPLGSIIFGCVMLEGHPTCTLQQLFMDTLSMNLPMNLNYLEFNHFGIVVQGVKVFSVCPSESYSEFWFLSTRWDNKCW